MSLKSGVLLSLFSGVSFTDLQRAATRSEPVRGPSAADVAHATRFAPSAQISTGNKGVNTLAGGATGPLRDAA
jgi:hypothetical protein